MVKSVSAVHIFYRANRIARFLKNLIVEPSRRKTVLIYLVMQYASAATFRRPFMANGKRLAFIAIGGAINCFECCMTLRFGAATVWNYGPRIFAYGGEDDFDPVNDINFSSCAFFGVPWRCGQRWRSGCSFIRMRKLSAADDWWLFASQLVWQTALY